MKFALFYETADNFSARTSGTASLARPGRYQLEAAIQSVHAARARDGVTRWDVIADLYATLMRRWPSVGARVAGAAAAGEAFGAQTGLDLLEMIDPGDVATYQPAWAVRAHLLAGLHRDADAIAAYERAMGLAEDAEVRAFLQARCARLVAGR